ncbi:MAG: hypothetical protein ABSE73_06955 [Planctomycetota bacterium]
MPGVLLHCHVNPDGELKLKLPAVFADAEVDVAVSAPNARYLHDPIAWRKAVLATAGSIPDPSFRRHEQGAYEKREPF